jgi:hypothetical protein
MEVSHDRVICIHGVNFFDEPSVRKCVQRQLSAIGYMDEEPEVINWDIRMGHPMATTPSTEMNLRFLVEVGAGLLQSANLGFLGPRTQYQELSSSSISEVNKTTYVYLWACLLSPAILSVAFLTHHVAIVVLTYLIAGFALTSAGIQGGCWASLRVCLRRAVLIGVWPVVLTATLPLAMPVFLFMPLALLAFYWIFVNPLSPFNKGIDSPWLTQAVIDPAAIILVVYLVATMCSVLRKTWIGVILKILADVFRYVGLEFYRSRLQDQVHQSVTKIIAQHPARILFLTHSLGSVIAVDYLRTHRELLARVPEVTLVTMGSPLRHLFAQFFPDFFPEPDVILKEIKPRGVAFRWVNIYRPFDPIGTDLAVVSGEITSLSTGQRRGRWLRLPAHLDYWCDSKVSEKIKEGLSSGTLITKNASPEQPPRIPIPAPSNSCEYGWYEPTSYRGRIWCQRQSVFERSDRIVRRLTSGWAIASFLFSAWLLFVNNLEYQPSRFVLNISILGFISYLFNELWPGVVRPFLDLSTCCIDRFPEPAIQVLPEAARAALAQSAHAKRAIVTSLRKKSVVCLAIVIPLLIVQFPTTSGWSTIRMIDLLGRPNNFYHSASFSPDGLSMITSADGVHIWDLNTPKNDRTFKASWDFNIISYTDPKCFAAGGKKQIKVWNDGRETSIEADQNVRFALSVDCDSQKIIAVGPTGLEVLRFDNTSPMILAHNGVHADVSANGRYAAFCSGRWLLEVMDIDKMRWSSEGPCYPGGVLTFSPDSHYLAYDLSSGSIGILSLGTGEKRSFDQCEDHGPFAVGSKAAIIAVDCRGWIRIYDGSTFIELAHSSEFHTPYVDQLIISPDNKRLAIVSEYASSIFIKEWKRAGARQWLYESLERLGIKGNDVS